MSKNFDLAVAYRIYPGVSKIPPIFADDKLKLSELCLYSFKQSLGNLRIKLFALLDNCPDIYISLFKKYFSEEELEIYKYEGIGNAGTFDEQIRILSGQNYSEYIYFAEDDYFYLNGAIPEILNFIKNSDKPEFVSSYYHSDYENLKIHHQFSSEQIILNETIWKSVASTTMTFLTTKSALKESEMTFKTYLKGNYDASIWFSLTKHKVTNPFNIFKYIFTDYQWFKIFLKSWIFTHRQIISGKKYNLFVHKESLSTHMDSKCLPDGVDWQNEFNKIIKKINFIS